MVERRKAYRRRAREVDSWPGGIGREREKRAINERGRLEWGRRTVSCGTWSGVGRGYGNLGMWYGHSLQAGVGGAGHVESQASGPRMGCTVTLFCLFSAWNQTFSEARRY